MLEDGQRSSDTLLLAGNPFVGSWENGEMIAKMHDPCYRAVSAARVGWYYIAL